MPRVHITGSQDDLGVGVRLNEFLSKGTSRPVTDSLVQLAQVRCQNFQCESYLAVTQKLVPFLAAEFTNTIILSEKSIVPHQAVRRVLHARRHHVVTLEVSQALKSNPQRSRSSTSHTKSQHLHGHRPVALSSVDACVVGEDIGDGLRGEVVGVSQRHGDSVEIVIKLLDYV